MPDPFVYRWSNGVDPDVIFQSQYGLNEITGDLGPAFDPVSEMNPEGNESIAAGAAFKPGVIRISADVFRDGSTGLFDTWRVIARALRPMLTRYAVNTGYLYYTENADTADPRTYRVPVRPLPITKDRRGEIGPDYIPTTIAFLKLSEFWEVEPADAVSTVIKAAADATWITASYTATLLGDAHAFPTFEVDGPTSGTLTAVTLTNGTVGTGLGTMAFTGLTLVSGQRLTITTAPSAISAGTVAQVTTISTGDVVADAYPLRSQTTNFWHLEAGSGGNALAITKNATSQSRVAISYRSRWWLP